ERLSVHARGGAPPDWGLAPLPARPADCRGSPIVFPVVAGTAVVFVLLVDIMDVDRDTSVHAAADALADRRDITARSDDAGRRHLRDVDVIALRVRRHRMRGG